MSLRTRFLLLTALRWMPTGLIIPVFALLPLQRGLTIAELGAVAAVQGVVVLVLELPTGGLADAWGRKPVLLVSSAFAVASYVVFAAAQSPAVFAVSTALAGTYRALDSGPLNAWYVDSVRDATPEVEHRTAIASGVSGAVAVVGVSLGVGAVLSSALVAWAPVDQGTALTLPYLAAAVLAMIQLGAVVVLMQEEHPTQRRGMWRSVRATPEAIGAGLGLLRRSRVLRALVAVELFWGFGMVAFETYTPIRLSELVDDRGTAASVMGPVVAAAWGISALGAAAVPWSLRRWSASAISVALRLVQGGTVVAMGLAWGPVGLVAGYVATYAVHSGAGAIYETLLHEQAPNEHRATVLSLASMAMHPAGSLGALVLGVVATAYSTSAAFVLGGVVLALAAPLFLVGPGPRDVRLRVAAGRGRRGAGRR